MLLTPELVALTKREVKDDGPEPGWTPVTGADIDCLVNRVIAEAGEEPIWVFAYGSLVWNPEFQPSQRQRATAYGLHRAFSLKIKRWRATSDQPGLMLALEPGGRCDGIILQLPQANQKDVLRALMKREIRYREFVDMVRWIKTRTDRGVQIALVFWASTKSSPLTSQVSVEETAELIATACGEGGSCAEYLYNTITDLNVEGIRDRNLWRLQALVAQNIRKLHLQL